MKNHRTGQISRTDVAARVPISRPSRIAVIALLAGFAYAGFAYEALAQSIDFDIVAQPTDDTLLELAETAGIQIAFAADRASKSKSPPITGPYSVEEALDAVLQGTGLDYQFANTDFVVVTEDGTLGVQAISVHAAGTGHTSQLARLQARLQASDAGVDAREQKASSQVAAGTSVVSGKVTDARTGANLKGALITIEETGQTTSTNDLGEFRFPGVPEGVATITVSYLGYANQSAVTEVRGPATSRNFSLLGGSAVEEIVVFGQRSARAQALNQERTAPNVSTVISSDLLGEFGGQTISETLRRAPGVSFNRDRFTGDGTNIVIRGLEPNLNAVKLNGVELPEGSGRERSANLGNILTESISEVTISKSLLASQDSAGTGGLVDIKTKSPLDRPRRFASFSVEGARRGDDFNEEFSASGTVSTRFGADDNVGISASVQYRDAEINRAFYSSGFSYGEYLPLQVDGRPTIRSLSFVDSRTPFPFEPGVDDVYVRVGSLNLDTTDSSFLGVTLAAAWSIGEHTDLRFDYQRSRQNGERFWTGTSLNSNSTYSLQPVAALNGEERRALRWPGRLSVNGSYQYAPEDRDETDVFSFNGQTDIDDWSFSYSASYTAGESRRRVFTLFPNRGTVTSSDVDLVLPEAVDPVEGVVISPFPRVTGRDSIPIPLLTPAAFAFINDPANHGLRFVSERPTEGENDRFAGDFSATYSIERGIWKNVQVGGAVELSEFTSSVGSRFRYSPAATRSLSLADVGLSFEAPVLEILGIDGAYNVIGRDQLASFLGALPSTAIDEADAASAGPGDFVRFFEELSSLTNLTKTQENEFSAFLQAELQIGKLQIIPGVRLSHFDIEAVNPSVVRVSDEDFSPILEIQDRLASRIATGSAKQTKLLPRILANYRHSEDLIFRFGYFKSIARPQINLLSSPTSISLSFARVHGTGDQRRLSLSESNPDLQPAQTDNFDLSMEWYDGNLGVVKLGAFYKRIDNLLENNTARGDTVLADIALPDDPVFQDVLDNPDDYDISLRVPANNESAAEIWGVEAAFEHQFTYLPGMLSGLGVIANYTYTDSSKEQPVTWSFSPVQDANGDVVDFEPVEFVVPDVSFNSQSPHSGSVGLTYSKHDIDANIIYTSQARNRERFLNHGLSRFEEGFATLDARIEYRFSPEGYGSYRIFFEGADLLRGTDESTLQFTSGEDDGTTPKFFTNGSFFGGRQFRLGVIGRF